MELTTNSFRTLMFSFTRSTFGPGAGWPPLQVTDSELRLCSHWSSLQTACSHFSWWTRSRAAATSSLSGAGWPPCTNNYTVTLLWALVSHIETCHYRSHLLTLIMFALCSPVDHPRLHKQPRSHGLECFLQSMFPISAFQRCFTSTETTRLIRDGEAQDGHLDFHTAPELWRSARSAAAALTQFRSSSKLTSCINNRQYMWVLPVWC